VWLAKDEKKEVAIKVVKLYRHDNEGVDVALMREIGVLRMLEQKLRPHPNLARMLDFFIKNKEAHMVFDRAECNLYEWQHGLPGSVVPYEKVACIASQMWSALEHLHMHEVMHRDLKPQNLLVEEGGARIRVADFGMARVVRGRLCCKPDQPDRGDSLMVRGAHTPDQVVTLWYRAPEVLLGTRDYTPAIDVWSGACIVVEMCTGKPPFQGGSDIEQMFATFQTLGTPEDLPLPMSTFPHFTSGCLPRFRARELTTVYDLMMRPPHLRVDLPDNTTRLLLDCLVLDWTQRPTAGEAMERMANSLNSMKGDEPSDSKRLKKCVP
jgi:cyclin-dependent kinase 2